MENTTSQAQPNGEEIDRSISSSSIDSLASSTLSKTSNNDVSPTNSTSNSAPNSKKHVRILTNKDSLLDDKEQGLYKTTSFLKRPLSDTPVGSVWNSPGTSREDTPNVSRESSAMNLLKLNKINSNTEPSIKALLKSNLITGNLHLQHGSTPNRSPNKNNENNIPSGMISPSRFTHPKKIPTTLDVPGLTKSKTSPDGTISTEDAGSKLIIIMVGLPATGKSFITNKLSRYLNYLLYYCRAFNVGNTRRQFAKEHGLQEQDSTFFDPDNQKSKQLREKWAMDTLQELLDYLLNGKGSVGIFDATNTSRKRRKHVLNTIRERSKDIQVLFLETVCSDKFVVERNIQLKLCGPDYKGKDPTTSLRDFKERLSNYTKAYEPIEDSEDIPYIKMIDISKKVISYKIQGFLASQTVYYLLNFSLAYRQIWISRNGESEYNVSGRIGGDSHLTKRGEKYALALTKFINERREIFHNAEIEKQYKNPRRDEDHQVNEFFVWHSPRRRCCETIKYFDEADYPTKEMKMLEELNAGNCEGMTYAEIKRKYPEGYAERQRDKLRYRYPGIGGESYTDVINRVKSVITEIERIEDNVLIVTHRVIARVLLGYFLNLGTDTIANLDIPLHCVYCLDLKPYGISWTLYEYNEEKDSFYKVPESVLNTTKVREISLVNKERRYSVVPTAPTTKNRSVSNPGPRSQLDDYNNGVSDDYDEVSTPVGSEINNTDRGGKPIRSKSVRKDMNPRATSNSNTGYVKAEDRKKEIQFEIAELERRLKNLKEPSRISEYCDDQAINHDNDNDNENNS
ncbi:hypothetical protein TPHA_0F01180 [Tetrapisispora phaffii CBS 4417]|uniref:6-phosphofructo-2-kinase domain-containing protein n=1 Tax=Tetrapisispora phaffii (strain ATCC 24235 / CBS 4417 / NBRC 1672 / NRRL Y-8282 / UCD 70-5) TaxID=1071381 RepID=G8BV21_TETPH|nr:hypothetical protein TPHA_0F01180 [Tetrapisispora phaffii CBS 4417]CCE63603.1 hypothetical protein TPHA_0F01180 [Tetrapisispora phaffii CBS 4417]